MAKKILDDLQANREMAMESVMHGRGLEGLKIIADNICFAVAKNQRRQLEQDKEIAKAAFALTSLDQVEIDIQRNLNYARKLDQSSGKKLEAEEEDLIVSMVSGSFSTLFATRFLGEELTIPVYWRNWLSEFAEEANFLERSETRISNSTPSALYLTELLNICSERGDLFS